jgi:hypothetical protein
MVNYIVSVYAGNRRGYKETPVMNFLEKHFNFLENKPNSISGFTFVINKSGNDQEFIEIINKFIEKSELKGKLIVRENLHGSYGAWENAILETYNDYTYSFMIEDDYIPSRVDFVDFFIKKIKNHCYVSSLWQKNHSSISNSLLDNSIVKNIFDKHNRLFYLYGDNSYNYLTECQLNFTNLLECNITDITDIGYTIFNSFGRKIPYKNSSLPLLIEPI